MELQRVVGAQANVQPCSEKLRQRVPLVRQEQRVVAQRAHGDADLLQVEQVLECGHLSQENPVRDGVGRQERRRQVVRVTGLPGVGAKHESI